MNYVNESNIHIEEKFHVKVYTTEHCHCVEMCYIKAMNHEIAWSVFVTNFERQNVNSSSME